MCRVVIVPAVQVSSEGSPIDRSVARLFALVTEAVAGATQALLHGEISLGTAVIEGDRLIDELTLEVEQAVWDLVDTESPRGEELRRLIGILRILPELERSADLAEHIAQRAVINLGAEMRGPAGSTSTTSRSSSISTSRMTPRTTPPHRAHRKGGQDGAGRDIRIGARLYGSRAW